MAQATSRPLLHELGLALAEPADRPADPKMAALVDRLRIGRGTAPPAKARTSRRARKAFQGE